jgi:hypothetical protein
LLLVFVWRAFCDDWSQALHIVPEALRASFKEVTPTPRRGSIGDMFTFCSYCFIARD